MSDDMMKYMPTLIRWGQVVEWLGKMGLSRNRVKELKRCGVFREWRPPGKVGGWAYYHRDEIYKNVVEPLELASGRK